MFSKFRGVLTLAALTLVATLAAAADTITVSRDNPLFPYGSVNVTAKLDASVSGTGSYFQTTSSAGMFALVQTGGTWDEDPLGGTGTEFYAFCFELRETLGNSNVTYDVVDLQNGRTTGLPKPIGTVRAGYIAQILTLGGLFDFTAPLQQITLGNITYSVAEVSAAIQTAIWEVAYETSSTFDVDNGKAKFDSTSRVEDLADYFLSKIGTVSDAPNLFALNNKGRQDLVVQIGTPNVEVPEPGSMALLGLGLLGLGVLRRKMAQRAA